MKRLSLILALALLNGLVFVFLVPPWQHYDEPNHFEYAWLVARRPGWPQEGDFDRGMRVATLQSMIAHDFFRGMAGIPDLNAPEPWIGPIPQVGDSPLYYGLVSVPLRFFPPLEIDRQLYAARLVSLLLFLGTVYLGWLTTALLVPDDSPLRWMAPAFLATLPAFADVMTSVNNDVAAVAAFALFLYAATSLLVRGWRWRDALLLLAAAGLCLLAKRTVFFAAVLVPVVLLFAALRGKRRRYAWGLFALGALLVLIVSFRFGDAAGWYRRTVQEPVTRVERADAPDGSHALRLHIVDGGPQYQLIQLLPTETVPMLSGRTLTLGAWMWPIPITTAHKVLLVDGFEYPLHRQLQQLILYDRYSQRTLGLAILFGNVLPSDEFGSVSLPLELLDKLLDVLVQVLLVLPCTHPIHTVSGVFADVAPGIQQHFFVEHPIQVLKPMLLLLSGLLRYSLQ